MKQGAIQRLFAALILAAVAVSLSGCGDSGSSNSTKTTLTASSTDVKSGTAILFTADVLPTSATGNVDIKDGSTVIATSTIITSTGRATATVSTLAPGSHSITANYQGDSILQPSTSDAVTITISASAGAPSITQQPASLMIAAGGSATFTVGAGGGNPTYQWMKDSTPIPGAFSSSYTINSTVTSDAGVYSVKVSNSKGSTTSESATLTIN